MLPYYDSNFPSTYTFESTVVQKTYDNISLHIDVQSMRSKIYVTPSHTPSMYTRRTKHSFMTGHFHYTDTYVLAANNTYHAMK